MYIFLIAIIFMTATVIVYCYRKSRSAEYIKKKAEKALIYDMTGRVAAVRRLVSMIMLEDYIKDLSADMVFYRYLAEYEVEDKLNTDIILAEPAGSSDIDEERFRRYLSSQNSQLRIKAAEVCGSFLYISSFINERFRQEKDERVIRKLVEETDLILNEKALADKLCHVQDERSGALILERLYGVCDDISIYSTYIESVRSPVFKTILTEMIYHGSCIERLLMLIEEVQDEVLFNLISGILTDRDLSSDDREKLIRISEDFQHESVASGKEDIAVFFANPVNLYRHISYIVYYDDLSAFYLISRIIIAGNDRLTAYMASVLVHDRRDHVVLLKDIVCNGGIISARAALLSLVKLDKGFDDRFVSAVIDREDDEMWYVLVPVLADAENNWKRKHLRYMRRYGSKDVKNRIKKLI